MAEDRIDSYIDLQATEKETQQFLSMLTELETKFDKLNSIKIDLSAATKAKDIAATAKQGAAALDDLDLTMKAYQATVDQTARAQAKLSVAESEAAKELEKTKQASQARNRELKNEVAAAEAAEGSIVQLRAQLRQLQTDYDNLSRAEREAAGGQQLLGQIQGLDKELKALEGSTGRFQRRVGDYQGSAKIIVDALERAREKFNTLSKAADTTPAALSRAKNEFEALRNVVDNKQFLSFSGNVGDATKEVRTFTRTLVNLESQGLGNSDVAQDLRKRLAELTDQIGDTRAEVKALASDTRSFDLFAGAVKFAADTFQVAASSAIAFGASEEDAAEATKTLLAIQNISNGVQGIANELTTKGTAANKLYAFAQNQVATAFDSSAAAGVRFRAALVTLGIGALIVGIGLLVANFGKLKDMFSRLSEEQKSLNKINKDAIDGYIKEKVHVESLVKEVNNETTSKKRKKEIIKELNDISPTYFSNIKSEKDLQDKLNESVVKYIRAIELKARAQAAENAFIESERPIVERQIELQRQLLALNDKTFDTEERKQRHIQGLSKTIEASNKALSDGVITPEVDKIIAELIKKRGPIQKIVTDINAELQSIGGDPNKPIATPFVPTKKARTGDLQAEAEDFEKIASLEDAHLVTRLAAREKAFELRKKIIEKERDVELQNLNAQIAAENAKGIIDDNKQQEFSQQRLNIIADYSEKEKELNRKAGTEILAIRQSYIAKQREIDQQANEQFFKDQEDALKLQIDNLQDDQESRLKKLAEGQVAELQSLNTWYQQRVAATREGSKERQKVEEEYARRRADIEYSYALAALKTQIEFAQKVIAARKAAGQDVSAAERELSELRIQLSDLETQHIIDNEDRIAKTRKDRLDELANEIEQIQDIYGKVTGIIGGLIDGIFAKQQMAIQKEIDDVEKRKDTELKAIDALTLSEQEKADKITIAEANAQTKREGLERRQRQLELQKARFEKARIIGEIILNTALAVVKALPNIPLALVAGSLGAAQLAVAIAQPLPQYKDGRKGGPAEWAITGDGGKPEVLTSPDMKHAMVTPATDTVTWLPQGWNVFPDVDSYYEAATNVTYKPVPQMPNITDNGGAMIAKAVTKEIRSLKQVVKNKQETHIQGSHAGVMALLKYGNTWIDKIDKKVNF